MKKEKIDEVTRANRIINRQINRYAKKLANHANLKEVTSNRVVMNGQYVWLLCCRYESIKTMQKAQAVVDIIKNATGLDFEIKYKYVNMPHFNLRR